MTGNISDAARLKLSLILANIMDAKDNEKDEKITSSIWNQCIAQNDTSVKMGKNKTITVSQASMILLKYLKNISEEAYNNICKAFGIEKIDDKGNLTRRGELNHTIREEYDNKGNIIKSTEFYEDGSIADIYGYEYDENGKISKETSYNELSGDIYSISEYDENGEIVETSYYLPDGKTNKLKYKNGICESNLTYDKDGKIIEGYKNEFNKENKITRTFTYLNGKISSIAFYKYDNKGNLSEVKLKNAEGITTQHEKFSEGKCFSYASYDNKTGKLLSLTLYDENGKLAKTTWCNEDGSVDYETIYNNDDTKTTTYFNDNGTKAYEENYDDGGNLIGRIYYGSNGKVSRTEVYENGLWTITRYDEVGRIISQETSEFLLDGVVGDSAQREQGDCYLMASINAIRQTAGGQEYLNSLIKKDGENRVVTLPGAKIAANSMLKDGIPKDKMYITGEYTFTPDEMREIFDKAGTNYSTGDNDTILIEAAFERYRAEVRQTMDENNLSEIDERAGRKSGKDRDNILEGGKTYDAIFILTGQQSEKYGINYANYWLYSSEVDPLGHKYEKLPTADSPSFKGRASNSSDKVSVDDIDTNRDNNDETKNNGTSRRTLKKLLRKIKEDRKQNINKYIATASFETKGGGSHAYTIKDVTEDSVILINPWHPDKTITMDIKEFIAKTTSVSVAEMPKKRL